MPNLAGFDASQHEERQSLDVIPKGEYLATATDSEWKDTRSGTGRYLQFVFKIADGEHKGRLLWARMNLENSNKTAVDIAKRELAELCRACGTIRPSQSEELHGVPVVLKVAVRIRKDNGEPSNEIKGYLPASGTAAKKQPVESASSDASDSPPWA